MAAGQIVFIFGALKTIVSPANSELEVGHSLLVARTNNEGPDGHDDARDEYLDNHESTRSTVC